MRTDGPAPVGAHHPSRRIRPGEILLFGRACLALLHAQLLVWRLPTGKLISEPTYSDREQAHASGGTQIERLAKVLHAAATRLPIRPVCLVRAVALARFLAAQGHPQARVRAGVRLAAGRLQGHAWVEYHGQPIGEDPAEIDTFSPMANVEVQSFP